MANVFQFQKVPVEVQKRNGFDESHRASGSATCGTLTPVLSKLMIPATEFSLDAVMSVDFPPFATDFKGRINAAIECFWIPRRLCNSFWKDFIKQGANANNAVLLPWVFSHGDDPDSYVSPFLGNGSLADYLGFGLSNVQENIPVGAAEPFVAYGLVYNYWYRNKNVQTDLVFQNASDASAEDWQMWAFYHDDLSLNNPKLLSIGKVGDFTENGGFSGTLSWADGVSLFALRQRNYPKDYFTALFPTTMVNGKTLAVDTSQGDKFDIAQFRAANAGTLFLERYTMAGSDYDDIMFAMYGIRPSDAAVNHPLYLGRIRNVVYNRYVDNNNGASSGNNRNPLSGVLGGAGARGNVADRGNLVKKFTVTEFGYLMCLFSVWPDAQYNQGTRRDNLIADITQLPFPLLQSIGFDKVYNAEIYSNWDAPSAVNFFAAFAYGERYAWYKFEKDHVNGLLRPGANLASFALQRNFDGVPAFGSDFIQVNKSDFDNVFAVSQAQSGFSCWYDIYFSLRVAAPLAAYCIPTLGEPKDARTVWIENGGHML